MTQARSMTRWRKTRVLFAAALFFLAGAVLTPHPAAAVVTADEASARIAAEFKVDVLRVKSDQIEGAAVWLITVMTPGGDSNDAFQINVLAVDKITGDLVPAFRHSVNGVKPDGGAASSRSDVNPDVLRSRTWR